MTRPRQVCTRCVMDTSAPDITFDADGVCNFCTEFLDRSGHLFERDAPTRERELAAFVATVKRSGKRGRYDCVVGVSGGVDSSWALVQVVRLGLRPLAVHMDNGWNSELAQNNIANLVRRLGVDLHTHVIDWVEYRTLMQAFFDADVLDVEVLYDNAMIALNYQQAAKHRIKYILAGTNESTEGMRLPSGWNWLKYDKRQIKAIGRQLGGIALDTFPAISTIGFLWYRYARRIRWISFLDYVSYNKAEALEALKREYDFKPYPFKHCESIFTRFYQGYILPHKFGVDKRRVHLSALVASGQMSREEALRGLEGIPYSSASVLEEDKLYFIKKMRWTAAQLEEYIARAAVPHTAYPSERQLWECTVKALAFSLRVRRALKPVAALSKT